MRELPGYDQVGYRETNLVNWGCFDDPDYVSGNIHVRQGITPGGWYTAGPSGRYLLGGGAQAG